MRGKQRVNHNTSSAVFGAGAFLAAALSLVSTPAVAADLEGNDALALAARVGVESPKVTRAEKLELASFLNSSADQRMAAGHAFKVASDNVQCRVGNIDLTEHDCTLTFGAKTVTIEGREAQALYVTMGSNGVEAEGAMGSSYRAVKQLSCTIDPKAIAEKDGSGIHCSYASGP